MKINEKLNNIQNSLVAPKGQYNKFANFKYRSCEDILEAVKPLLKKEKVTLLISDEIIQAGERYYIKATAKLICIEDESTVLCTAYAREAENKKGMDCSQITGSTSSYARKYALNGLFCIDDTKDADTQNNNEIKDIKEIKQLTKEENEKFDMKVEIDNMLRKHSINISPEKKKIINDWKNQNLDTLMQICVELNDYINKKMQKITK